MSNPLKIAVVFHSGYGHTLKLAEAVAAGAASVDGATVDLISVEEVAGHWDTLDAADAIIMGAPTYMGSLSAQFKAFMDATSNVQYREKRWDGKVAAGFTIGGSRGGDKQTSLVQLMTFAAQHNMHWVNLGLGYGNNRSNTNDDILNRDTYSLGMAAQANIDQGSDVAPPDSDLRTGAFLGKRVAEVARIFCEGRKVLGWAANPGLAGGSEVYDPEHRGVSPA